MRISLRAAACAAATLYFSFSSSGLAEEVSPCSLRVTSANLIPCALQSSLLVEAQRHGLSAAEARKESVSPYLPSNPTLAMSAARRASSAMGSSYNWTASLSQELEVAGQRQARRGAASAHIEAQSKRVLISQREVAVTAWQVFFDALAAQEEQRLAHNLMVTTEAVAAVARGKVEQGLLAPVDADVADASAVRTLQLKHSADRRRMVAESELAYLLGLDPAAHSLVVEGELAPLPGSEALARNWLVSSGEERPEVQALDAERKAMILRAEAFRRSRIPNPTVSVFAQNDGFGEKVVGLGISFPIPMPGRVGRRYVGEIAEAEALAHQAASDRERVRREIRLEVVTSAQSFESRRQEVSAFPADRLKRAEETLAALGQEVAAGRLGIRDAVVAQQSLIDFLQANVAARRALALASVDLARALGLPLEKGRL